MNKYGVEFSDPSTEAHKPKLSSSELLCQLKEKVQVTTLTSDLRPFSLLPWAAQLPLKQLTAEQGPFKSCAVVSSAGSLRKSGLGKEIGEDFCCCCYFAQIPNRQSQKQQQGPDLNRGKLLFATAPLNRFQGSLVVATTSSSCVLCLPQTLMTQCCGLMLRQPPATRKMSAPKQPSASSTHR